ncbi:Aerobic respiration control sensor protein arcB [Klebsiella pneumoniae]|uniref:Aerobic respiration control sensor protein arcB n=1 Tax=Klebsiella pneumoniae TaxID=573 RepID=A0A447RSH9_KLEPN|nr:Aerobic respiration control sensor protein arcB [Klebsiella pneumoniae]
MKQIRMLAQYYVDLMMKLGLVRFSMLLALALVVLAIVVQMAVTMVLHGQVESIDVIRSIFFGLPDHALGGLLSLGGGGAARRVPSAVFRG